MSKSSPWRVALVLALCPLYFSIFATPVRAVDEEALKTKLRNRIVHLPVAQQQILLPLIEKAPDQSATLEDRLGTASHGFAANIPLVEPGMHVQAFDEAKNWVALLLLGDDTESFRQLSAEAMIELNNQAPLIAIDVLESQHIWTMNAALARVRTAAKPKAPIWFNWRVFNTMSIERGLTYRDTVKDLLLKGIEHRSNHLKTVLKEVDREKLADDLVWQWLD